MRIKGFSIGIIFLVLMVCTTCNKDEAPLTPDGESSALKDADIEGEVFPVSPSGGDDTELIETALLEAMDAGPGCVVQLAEGTYYIARNISVYGFDGYIKGAGKDKTIITQLPGSKIDGVVGIWNQSLSCVLTFYGGNIRMSDLTIVITDPKPAGEQYEHSNALVWLIQITVDDDSDPRTVSSSLDNIGFIGGPGDFRGFNILHAVSIAHPDGIEGGTHTLTNCDFNHTFHTYQGYGWNDDNYNSYYKFGTWLIGGSPNSGNSFKNCMYGPLLNRIENSEAEISYNTFEEMGYEGADFRENKDSKFVISTNTFKDIGLFGAYFRDNKDSEFDMFENETSNSWSSIYIDPYKGYSGTFLIHNNNIELNCDYGIVLVGQDVDFDGSEIKNNTISTTSCGIALYGVHHVEVNGNNISTSETGQAIWVEWGKSFSPAIGNEIKSNIVEEGCILVGAYALNNEIVDNLVNGAFIDYLIEDHVPYELWDPNSQEYYVYTWLPRPSNNYILVKEGDIVVNDNTCGYDICEAFDDDMDGLIDEDPYDQIDNDGDGRIDEDPIDLPNEIINVTGKPLETLEMVENDLFFSNRDKNKKKLLESKTTGFPK